MLLPNASAPQALSQLQVSDFTPTSRRSLFTLVEQILAVMEDRHSVKAIEKVRLIHVKLQSSSWGF